jgi:hypothetical protein
MKRELLTVHTSFDYAYDDTQQWFLICIHVKHLHLHGVVCNLHISESSNE